MKFKYIFVDEVSMLQEKFYKFLLMVKKFKPETKFIISGDYNQLEPVADRISPEYNYARNPALFELCNFNKIQLTKCRRADDKLFQDYGCYFFDLLPDGTFDGYSISEI
jgi:ATP-dependent exoDNAse (exonuclease V) alpha subunit